MKIRKLIKILVINKRQRSQRRYSLVLNRSLHELATNYPQSIDT
ncbi:MAG: hypothetical protein ACFBSE_25695 [Prochloraceae cyanobacterium]